MSAAADIGQREQVSHNIPGIIVQDVKEDEGFARQVIFESKFD